MIHADDSKGEGNLTESMVGTRYGRIKGDTTDDVSVWKGIPYAQAPIGPLRFRPPEPPEPWGGVYDATKFGPAPLQPIDQMTGFLDNRHMEMSEDCLYLNIWSPAADDKRRPVLVWMHGGAYLNGSGASSAYNGTAFATNGDVVVVTINYRLGVMGFLHLDEMDGTYQMSGNCGILDQVAALKWVRENIAAFGGDPNRVTIFGESAGAMSVGILLGIPSAKGLFHQAILQSGAARIGLSREAATDVAQKVLGNLETSANDLSRLKEIPAEDIMEAAKDIPSMALAPVIDGTVIPELPEDALEKGAANDIPILIGTNRDEHRFFTFFDPTWKAADEAEISRRVKEAFQPLPEKIKTHFMAQPLTQTLMESVLGFDAFTFPAIKLAEKQIEQGTQVWMYRFDWRSPAFDGGLLACHTMEIPFVFHNTDEPRMDKLVGDSPETTVASNMHQAWVNFAHHGDPNTPDLPEWQPYDTEKRPVMIFNVESNIENDPEQDKRRMWE